MNYSALDAFLGFIPGSFAETSTLAILIGGAILLFTGIASWRTMVSVFVGGAAMGSYLFKLLGVMQLSLWWHLIVGGFAFGAVFMATDPVTSAQTNAGKYIVGLMTGALAVLIRVVEPGLSGRGYDALDPLHERAGSAGGLLRRGGQHRAP